MILADIGRAICRGSTLEAFCSAIVWAIAIGIGWHFLATLGLGLVPLTLLALIALIDACILLFAGIKLSFLTVQSVIQARRQNRARLDWERELAANPPVEPVEPELAPPPPPPTPHELAKMLRNTLDYQLDMITQSGLPQEDQAALQYEVMSVYRDRLRELM